MTHSLVQEILEMKSFVHALMDLAAARSTHVEIQQFDALDEAELKAPKRTLAGWHMAVNDCMEMSSDWHADQVKAADALLHHHGLMTLSEARRRYSKKVEGILNRGRIRSDVEYYIVAGLVADLASQISEEDRARLEVMANRYQRSGT